MKTLFSLVLLFSLCVPAYAGMPVTCVNCSTSFVQALERITNMEQLIQMIQQVEESVTQTEQQIQMVQQNAERYANMLKNTAKLPQNMINQIQGNFQRLADLARQLGTLQGESSTLNEIFSATYATRSEISDLSRTPGGAVKFDEMWGKWSDEIERSQRAQFKLSGQQLYDLQHDAEQLEARIADLLNSPDGQMKAIEAGNAIAAMQLQEAQNLRMLLAVTAHASGSIAMKKEKDEQAVKEMWKNFLNGDKQEK